MKDATADNARVAERGVPRHGCNSSETDDDPLLAGFGSHNVHWA